MTVLARVLLRSPAQLLLCVDRHLAAISREHRKQEMTAGSGLRSGTVWAVTPGITLSAIAVNFMGFQDSRK
jgi:hypothetical protein